MTHPQRRHVVAMAHAGFLSDSGSGDSRAQMSPTDRWDAPAHVELVDSSAGPLLVPNWQDVSRVTLRSSLLMDFCELAGPSAADEEVAAFARRWGLLELCEQHGMPGVRTLAREIPAGLAKNGDPLYEEHGFGVCFAPQAVDPDAQRPVRVEPVAAWRQLADELQAVTHVAALLQADERVPDDLWARVARLEDPWSAYGFAADPRARIARLVAQLCEVAGLTWQVRWDKRHPQPVGMLTTSSLFAGLMAGVQAAMSGAAVALCSGCGQPYSVSKRPKAGQRSFCSQCGDRAAKSAAARDYRARKKAAQAPA
jgi:hypothetical protein